MNLRMKNASRAAVLALAGFLAVGVTLAGARGMNRPQGPHGGHGGHGGGMMSLLSQLDLSDDQKAQVKAIHDAERPKMAPLAEASLQAHRALGESIHAPAFDERAVRAAAARLGTAEGDLAVEKAQLASKIRSVLTPAQQKQLDGLRQQFLDRMQQRQDQRHAGWSNGPADPEETEDAPDAP